MSKKLYSSIAENLLDTGLHQVIFRKAARSAGLLPLNAADLEDLDGCSAMLKAAGSLGSLSGERVSDDLLRDVARHPSNPFQLVDNGSSGITAADHFVVEYGTLDNARAVWDQLIVPHLAGLGISRDPGHVERNAPAGLGEGNAPLPINDQDPAVKALYLSIDALRALARYHVILTQTADVPRRPS